MKTAKRIARAALAFAFGVGLGIGYFYGWLHFGDCDAEEGDEE